MFPKIRPNSVTLFRLADCMRPFVNRILSRLKHRVVKLWVFVFEDGRLVRCCYDECPRVYGAGRLL